MAEMEYDSEDEILDKRSIGTMSEDSEDDIQENPNVNDSATIYMDWVDHDLQTIAAGNYSEEYDELPALETDAQNDGDIQILQGNSVVGGQGALRDHDFRPTETNVNGASTSVHENMNLAHPDLGIAGIGMHQNEIVELELDSLASSALNNENRAGCNGFPEQNGPTPTPTTKKAPTKHKCSICSKKVAYLPLHMKWCHSKLQQEIPTTKCPICLKEFVNLPQHMNSCHGEAQQKAPKAKCPMCSKKFRYLSAHMKLSHAETIKGTPKPQCPTSSKARNSSSHKRRCRRDAPPSKAKKVPGKGRTKAVRPTVSNVNEASSVHETLTNPDRGIIAIGNGMPQNEVEELASLASSILNNENRTRHNGFPERSGRTPTPESITAPTKQECSICSKKIANLPQHMKWCHSKLQQKITTKCPICSNELVNLPKHMNQCHGEAQERAPKTKCPICSQKVRYLASHMKMIHAETVKGTPKRQCLTSSNAKQCSICTNEFMDLPHHLKRCRAKLPLKLPRNKCPICSKEVIMLPTHMKRIHRTSQEKAPKAQCPICLKKCVYLYLHIRLVHSETNKKRTPKRPCPICSKRIHHLPSHMRWNHPRDTRQNHELKKQDEQKCEKKVIKNFAPRNVRVTPRNVRVPCPEVKTASCPECSIIITKKNLQRHLKTVHRSATIPTPIATQS